MNSTPQSHGRRDQPFGVRLSNDPRHAEPLSRVLEITRDFTTPRTSIVAVGTIDADFDIFDVGPCSSD
jgi:hypothetical protein